MTTGIKEPTFTAHDIERAMVQRSFLFFLEFVKLLDPPTATNPGGIIQLKMWDHIKEAATLLAGTETEKQKSRLSVLKSRQVGWSWVLAAYALWTAQYHEGANVLIFSQGQLESSTFLGKVKTIHENLPPHLKIPTTRANDTLMSFGSKAKITALPSTENAGRGETASVVIQDEADFHENLDLNYAAIKPTIDRPGAQFIQVSTINKKTSGSLFKELYRNAPENGHHKVFHGWRSVPDRDDAWHATVMREAPHSEGMTPELYMEQEHPETEEEALRPTRAMAAFDTDALEAMQNDQKQPVETRNGVVNIYQKPAVGKRYAAGTDTSHGTGGDYATTAVIDVETGYVVADVDSKTLAPEHLAQESVRLLEEYGNPIWAIEDNDWGQLTIDKARDLKYPRLYERRNPNGQPSGRVGWHTDSRSRPLLWGELIEAVRERLITIPSQNGQSQFSTVIRNPDKDGRIEAMVGTHDDYPMAVGLAWQMRKEAYRRDSKIKVVTRAERLRRLGKL